MGILSEIWSSISRNRFRTAMTGFAVAWGIFILVVLLGASNGLSNGIQESYGQSASNSVEVRAGWAALPYKGLPKDRRMFFTLRETEEVRQMAEVDLFSCVVQKSVTANAGSAYSTVQVVGVEGDYQHIFRKTILEGRFINQHDEEERLKVCVLDKRTTEELGNKIFIGQYIQLAGIPFLVVGFTENGNRWEGSTVHIPFSTYQAIFGTDRKLYQMALTLRDNDIDHFKQHLCSALAPTMQFDPKDEYAVWIRSQQERVTETNKVMSAIRLFVLIIGLCTLISGAVGVSNIMLVSVKERTKEFGIRKAIGAPPKTILLTVVGESILITALFGYVGMFLGIGIMEVVNMLIPKGDFPFTNPTVDIPVVMTATLILIIVGVIAGAIPAVRAMKVKPIEAMNAEK